jgi:hypothetical protein
MVPGKKEPDLGDQTCRQPTDGIVASDVRVKKVDLVLSNHPRQAAGGDNVSSVAEAESMPCDRQISQGRGEGAALPDRQVEGMSTLDQRARQIRDVTFTSSHLLSGTDLQNLHPGDPGCKTSLGALSPMLHSTVPGEERRRAKRGGGWKNRCT